MLKTVQYHCAKCGTFVAAIEEVTGKRTEDSIPLAEDEHGMFAICPNEACKYAIRMENHAGIWLPARSE